MIRLKAGDEAARERFIVGNMRLVLSLVRRFWAKKANADDVFQAGCVGLIKAIDRFDPGYGLPAAQQAHILGITGTLWGEAMQDINRVTYMTYPRGLALAEAGWTQMEHRSWDSFKERMYPNLMNLMKHGVFVRVPFEIVPR